MDKIIFDNVEKYKIEVKSGEKLISHGYMNEKAWLKTVENNIIWEYIPENGRVIEKDGLKDWSVKVEDTKFDGKIITINVAEIIAGNNNVFSSSTSTEVFERLEKIIQKRKIDMPENSYTTHLFNKGEEKILKKTGEEAIEFILAKDNEDELVYETADLLYHVMVYYVFKGIPFNSVLAELEKRMK